MTIFQKIIDREIPADIVLETEYALAFRDIHPQAPVHVLVIPKGQYVSMDDFTARASDAEMAAFVRAIGDVARLDGIEGDGYRILSNIGKHGRQEVPHLHVHVIGGDDVGPMISKRD